MVSALFLSRHLSSVLVASEEVDAGMQSDAFLLSRLEWNRLLPLLDDGSVEIPLALVANHIVESTRPQESRDHVSQLQILPVVDIEWLLTSVFALGSVRDGMEAELRAVDKVGTSEVEAAVKHLSEVVSVPEQQVKSGLVVVLLFVVSLSFPPHLIRHQLHVLEVVEMPAVEPYTVLVLVDEETVLGQGQHLHSMVVVERAVEDWSFMEEGQHLLGWDTVLEFLLLGALQILVSVLMVLEADVLSGLTQVLGPENLFAVDSFDALDNLFLVEELLLLQVPDCLVPKDDSVLLVVADPALLTVAFGVVLELAKGSLFDVGELVIIAKVSLYHQLLTAESGHLLGAQIARLGDLHFFLDLPNLNRVPVLLTQSSVLKHVTLVLEYEWMHVVAVVGADLLLPQESPELGGYAWVVAQVDSDERLAVLDGRNQEVELALGETCHGEVQVHQAVVVLYDEPQQSGQLPFILLL